MYKLETTRLTISGILKNAWQLYKSVAIYLYFASLVLAVIHVIPYLFGFVGFFHQEPNGRPAFSWTGVLLFSVLLLVEAYFVAILLYTMYVHVTKQKANLTAIYRISGQFLLHVYLALLMYYLAINIGFILFVFPAIFIAILFSMFLPYIVIEKRQLINAFENSAKLVWGHWWQTFIVLALPYALIYAIRNILKFTPWQADWRLLIDLVILTITAPYFYAVLLVQFTNLKVIKALPKPDTKRPREVATRP